MKTKNTTRPVLFRCPPPSPLSYAMGLLDSLVAKRGRAHAADAAARAAALLDRVDGAGGDGAQDKTLDEVAKLLASMKVRVCVVGRGGSGGGEDGRRGRMRARAGWRPSVAARRPSPSRRAPSLSRSPFLSLSLQSTLFGDGDAAPSRDAALALAVDACAADLPAKLVAKLGVLDFETRKDAATVRGKGGVIQTHTRAAAVAPPRGAALCALRPRRAVRQATQPGESKTHTAHHHRPFFYLSLNQVIGAVFRINVDGATPGADYLAAHPDVVAELLEG